MGFVHLCEVLHLQMIDLVLKTDTDISDMQDYMNSIPDSCT